MDSGNFGAIAGTAIGILGGLAGSIFGTLGSLRNAKVAAQRRYLVRWAIGIWAIIAGFLAAVWLVGPAHWKWLWLAWILIFAALPFVIVAFNRGYARLASGSGQGR